MKHPLILTAACMLVVVACAGCTVNEENGETGRTVTMSMAELREDFHEKKDEGNKTISYWYGSVDEGDTLLLRDVIETMTVSGSLGKTTVFPESLPEWGFEVWGNLTNDFAEGDAFELSLHIANVTYQPFEGEELVVNIEVIREGWSTETNQRIPYPREVMRHVPSADSVDV
jgi:hypothetical protein